jgi:hypothetical protein
MALVARSVQAMDAQVSKIVIKGLPLSGDRPVKDVLAFYEKLAQDDPAPPPSS